MKRILVTGASGFIGRALVPYLTKCGYAVRAASRRPQRAGEGVEPVRSPDLAGSVHWTPLLEGIDAVVHAAAIAHTTGIDEATQDMVNHRAVAALAEAAQGRVERLIFLSSIRAQSGGSAAGVLTEGEEPRPTDAYGRAKLAGERALARKDVPFVVLRPVLVAGCSPSGNLAHLLRLARLPVPLPVAGVAARRSLIDRDDLCAAIAHVLDEGAHLRETYIVAHPEPIEIAAMIAALRRGLGRAPGLFAIPSFLTRGALSLSFLGEVREKLLGDLVASPDKLMKTGWTPKLSPEAALAHIGAAAAEPTELSDLAS
ncbi:MAG: NAD-dependent epimerase/dehydratase family protein [Hyphomicrobiales bacterium]|nr:NAD-dependent epimerase/dehydratase family protein [Hyphomicrobiales bacterium]